MNGIELELMQFPMVRADISASRNFDKWDHHFVKKVIGS